MRKILGLALLVLPLAACQTGTPVFDKVSTVQLEKAKAVCRMRLRDRVDMSQMADGMVIPNAVVDDAYDCFTAQGVNLRGFIQKDGHIHRYPVGTATNASGFNQPAAAAQPGGVLRMVNGSYVRSER